MTTCFSYNSYLRSLNSGSSSLKRRCRSAVPLCRCRCRSVSWPLCLCAADRQRDRVDRGAPAGQVWRLGHHGLPPLRRDRGPLHRRPGGGPQHWTGQSVSHGRMTAGRSILLCMRWIWVLCVSPRLVVWIAVDWRIASDVDDWILYPLPRPTWRTLTVLAMVY